MTIVIDGTNGVSGVDGTASNPSYEGTDSNTGIFFPAADTIAFAEGGAEVARFDSAGNFGLGTTSPQQLLDVRGRIQVSNGTNGGQLGVNAGGLAISSIGAAPVSFYYNTFANETVRIDSSGNFMVGGTAQVWDERLLSRTASNTVVGGFYSSSTSYTSSVIRAQAETAAGTGWYLFEGRSSGGSFQYGIRGNGTVATSDERRKKNIEPARSYLQDICSIPVVKYNWKTDSDDAPKELGWLAQDVEKVFPNMVVTHHDGVNDDQEVLLLKKEVFVPMLMKCIQEQQAMIDELKAKVAALEGAA
jgi:hypothetical protein